MFITAVCVLFLIKLRWPKNKSTYLLKLHTKNTASENRNTCQKRWWDFWFREDGSLLLKWKGCCASMLLQRQNDTIDQWGWPLPSRVGCRSMLVAISAAPKSSRRVFRTIEDGWCGPKAFPEIIRIFVFSALQGSLVLLCEARFSSVSNRRSVFWAWCRCKDSIATVAPP